MPSFVGWVTHLYTNKNDLGQQDRSEAPSQGGGPIDPVAPSAMKRLLLIALLRGLASLSWPAIQRMGGLVGRLLVVVPNRQRRDALINIRLCFPDLSPAEQVALRDRSLIEFARTFLEVSALWLWPVERVMALVREEVGTELIESGDAKGLILLAPHLGAWEMTGLYLATKGPVTSMYRPQRHVDDLIRNGRQRNGARLVPDDVTGVKRLLRALKQGEITGILPDQAAREESGSAYAPFFGVPASTMLLVQGLARRTGARVVCLFAERLPDGQGFRMRWVPAPDGVADPDPVTAATALNAAVEACIRICPEQYQWTYRRFRRRPDGGPSPYTGPS